MGTTSEALEALTTLEACSRGERGDLTIEQVVDLAETVYRAGSKIMDDPFTFFGSER